MKMSGRSIFGLQALQNWRGELAAGQPAARRAARTLASVLSCGTLDPALETLKPSDDVDGGRATRETTRTSKALPPADDDEHAVDRLRWLERWQAEIDAGEPAAQVAAQVLADILSPGGEALGVGDRQPSVARPRQPPRLVTSEHLHR